MEKSMTLNLRVNPVVKQQAEDVLKQLGIPMATAIDMYLRQIKLTGGIPFSVSLPKAPVAVNADTMSTDQLRMELMSGYDDLRRRPSTARYADAARGHHRWYDGTKGFPAGYSRMESLFRQMTDVAAVVSFLLDGDEDSFDESVRYVLEKDRGRFSPRVSAYLMDASLRNDLRDIMVGDRTEYYRDIYDGLMSED